MDICLALTSLSLTKSQPGSPHRSRSGSCRHTESAYIPVHPQEAARNSPRLGGFAQGKDTATGQDVAAILEVQAGWGVCGLASCVSDLERDSSRHLVVRITNAVTAMDICALHLRRPIGNEGIEKQKNQCRALLRWAMRHLATDPRANLVIMGDFSEGMPVGSEAQALSVLFQARPPMVDALSTPTGRISTHTDGKAYDRIFVSDAISKGVNHLKLEGVVIQPHRHGKGEERRPYTDHFPVCAVMGVP